MWETVFPVIALVPSTVAGYPGGRRKKALSLLSRRALEVSAGRAGVAMGTLAKSDNGAPLPMDGHFWSVSDKARCVAAILAPYRVGIDVEEVSLRRSALTRRVADEGEWALSGGPTEVLFARYWTAKEAVLKAAGVGLRHLSLCRIRKILDDRHLLVSYHGMCWPIEHHFLEGHVVSVVTGAPRVEWSILTL